MTLHLDVLPNRQLQLLERIEGLDDFRTYQGM